MVSGTLGVRLKRRSYSGRRSRSNPRGACWRLGCPWKKRRDIQDLGVGVLILCGCFVCGWLVLARQMADSRQMSTEACSRLS